MKFKWKSPWINFDTKLKLINDNFKFLLIDKNNLIYYGLNRCELSYYENINSNLEIELDKCYLGRVDEIYYFVSFDEKSIAYFIDQSYIFNKIYKKLIYDNIDRNLYLNNNDLINDLKLLILDKYENILNDKKVIYFFVEYPKQICIQYKNDLNNNISFNSIKMPCYYSNVKKLTRRL